MSIYSDEQPDLLLSNSNYTGSSNSSLSSGDGSDSPSISMEQVASGISGGAIGGHTPITSTANFLQHPHLIIQQNANLHSQQDSFQGSVGSSSSASNTSFRNASIGLALPRHFESDDEEDFNEADWSSIVPVEMLAALTDGEKKRQEIING